MRIAFFTASTIGGGHLMHGLALGNGLRRAGFSGEYRMVGPHPGWPDRCLPAEWRVATATVPEIARPETALRTAIARELLDFAPDLVLVDMFWAPLKHILPVLGCPAWLVLHWMPETWLLGPERHPFEPDQYDRIIALEPVEGWCITDRVEPVIVVNPDECHPPEAIRRRYGVSDGEKLIVVVQAGLKGEAERLAAAVPDGAGRAVVLSQADPLVPSAAWLSGADLILSGGGYNVFWESKWLGYHPRMRFTPMPRPIDNHEWRLTVCADLPVRQNGADTIAGWIMRG